MTRPILKWCGGKRQLLDILCSLAPVSFRSYHEPFVGGGALFFELSRQCRITRAYLSDSNAELMDCYRALRTDPGDVVAELKAYKHGEDEYYATRAANTKFMSPAGRAARMIYLNKTCFNGLYRVNRAGQFNVPFGKYTNPLICDEENLRACATALEKAAMATCDFGAAPAVAPGDFVYFDPPYHGTFGGYTAGGFDETDQKRLAWQFDICVRAGATALLSNSDTPFIRELYKQYDIVSVQAKRSVNSNGAGRGKVGEVIVVGRPK